MLDLLEIELTRVRRMAERVDNNILLLYLIDMAILEANRGVRSKERASAAVARSELFNEGYRSTAVTS